MRLDTTFDFRSDTPKRPGADPDKDSPMLRRYHQALWRKPLPSGAMFELHATRPGVYLLHDSPAGELQLSSDAAIPTFGKDPAKLKQQMRPEEVERFDHLGYTIGGMMLWPSVRYDGAMTINGARGFHPRIKDRLDLTVECIRRHYLGEWSPLKEVLGRYRAFFDMYQTFDGFIDFFLLQDLLSDDGHVAFFLPYEKFTTPAVPADAASYKSYMDLAIEFIEARNRRIDALGVEIPEV